MPQRPNFVARIKERFAKMRERSTQVKLGAEMAKDIEANTGLADKLKQRIDKIVATETKQNLGLDAQVEAEWLKSYQKIYQALGEGKIKQAMEKLTPVFDFQAKTARAVSHKIDQGLRIFAVLSVGAGLINVGAGENPRASNNFLTGYETGTAGFGNFAERFSVQSARAQGFVGERVVGIVNKILHKSV